MPTLSWISGHWLEIIRDVLDILLVGTVFYYLIVLLRGTKAIQLIKGMGVIFLVWLLSTYLKLTTLKWLMSQAFSLGLFAIIIIFQPELRRALEQLGSGRLIKPRLTNKKEMTGVSERTESLVGALTYLAKRRIGALIAIEQKTGLGEYIETGVTLESKLSQPLLIQLFIPNTPLHDGAVIIQGETIAAANCYLPLSENPLISQELGTRHRAAIGLSEVADALVLVVSEETGEISIAEHGKIERGVSTDRLTARLEMLTNVEETRVFFAGKGGRGAG
ncbi:MAG: TIGR00159 family protein [Candidatus Carbobacillus altaicus]|nr:TIGR00159 family protein [Candidatus Carbobacillus altaicus]